MLTTTAEAYPNILLALCIWREARNQPREVKAAVKHVILNRVAHPCGPFAKCKDLVSNILAPSQFSSFNHADPKHTDPNAVKLPDPANAGDWRAWQECCAVVDEDQPDPTAGANYYFDVSIQPPAWADPSKQIAQIGAMRFFRL